MSPRKGGIGRRPGKKRCCKQNEVSHSSLTTSKMKLRRFEEKGDEETKKNMKHILSRNLLVRVCVAGQVLCLESNTDEQWINTIIKEDLKNKKVLKQVRTRAKKSYRKHLTS